MDKHALDEQAMAPAPTQAANGSLYYREIEDGYAIIVYPMLFASRLCLAETGPGGGIVDGYCYPSCERALEAAAVWDGRSDPLDGWTRNPFDGRYRPDGDRLKERVRPYDD